MTQFKFSPFWCLAACFCAAAAGSCFAWIATNPFVVPAERMFLTVMGTWTAFCSVYAGILMFVED